MFVFSGCAVAVDDYYAFKEHTFTCDNARNSPSTTCVHCRRSFVKNDKFFDHINMHGVPRYWCSLCDFKYTSVPKVNEHMKTHKVWKTKTVPADSLKTNRFSDIFFIVPDLVSYSQSYSDRIQSFVRRDENNAPWTNSKSQKQNFIEEYKTWYEWKIALAVKNRRF